MTASFFAYVILIMFFFVTLAKTDLDLFIFNKFFITIKFEFSTKKNNIGLRLIAHLDLWN